LLHVSVCAADLRAHADELEVGPEPEIVTRVGFEDVHLQRIGQAFAAELQATAGDSLTSDARLAQAGVVLTSVAALAGDLATDFTQPKAQAAISILMSA
jgi:hypothetical protein